MATKSLSTYKEELGIICERNGFTGVITEMLKNVLSYAIYEDQYNIMVANNELDPDKATNINDVIDYAMSRLYSVYRGQNPIITLQLKSTIQGSISKYQQLWSGNGFQIFALDEVNNIMVGDEFTINCIVSTKLEVIQASEDDIDVFYVDFSQAKDVSENFLLRATETIDWIDQTITKSTVDRVDKGYVQQVTSYDYGIRFYFNEEKESRNLQTYELQYFPYYGQDINPDDIQRMKINGFEIIQKSIQSHIEREGLNDGIGDKARSNINSQGTIRSNEDMLSMFNTLFADKVNSSTMIVTGNKSPEGYSLKTNSIYIFYAPKSESNDIKQSELVPYINAMTPYIPCKTTVINGVISTEAVKPLIVEKATTTTASITVEVFGSTSISTQAIFDYLNSLQNKVNLSISIYQLMAEINSLAVTGYSIVKLTKDGKDAIELNLKKNEYLKWQNVSVNLNNR